MRCDSSAPAPRITAFTLQIKNSPVIIYLARLHCVPGEKLPLPETDILPQTSHGNAEPFKTLGKVCIKTLEIERICPEIIKFTKYENK